MTADPPLRHSPLVSPPTVLASTVPHPYSSYYQLTPISLPLLLCFSGFSSPLLNAEWWVSRWAHSYRVSLRSSAVVLPSLSFSSRILLSLCSASLHSSLYTTPLQLYSTCIIFTVSYSTVTGSRVTASGAGAVASAVPAVFGGAASIAPRFCSGWLHCNGGAVLWPPSGASPSWRRWLCALRQAPRSPFPTPTLV
jgi:hypothetical protein